jgi:hypothetical protein
VLEDARNGTSGHVHGHAARGQLLVVVGIHDVGVRLPLSKSSADAGSAAESVRSI